MLTNYLKILTEIFLFRFNILECYACSALSKEGKMESLLGTLFCKYDAKSNGEFVLKTNLLCMQKWLFFVPFHLQRPCSKKLSTRYPTVFSTQRKPENLFNPIADLCRNVFAENNQHKNRTIFQHSHCKSDVIWFSSLVATTWSQ